MNTKYVPYGDEYLPVVYTNAERKWFWKEKDWIGNYTYFLKTCFDKAQELDEWVFKIRDRFAGKIAKELLIQRYADDIWASYKIEGESLSLTNVECVLRKKFGCACSFEPKNTAREEAAVQAALSFLLEDSPVTSETLCSAHKEMGGVDTAKNQGTFGSFRTGDVVVGGVSFTANEPLFRVVFEAPETQLAQKYLQDVLAWFVSSDIPQALKAALIHLYFAEIHPFHDGNGRMARLLFDKTLQMDARYRAFLPTVPVSWQIIHERSAYYETLNRASAQKELGHFLDYIFGCMEKSLRLYIEELSKLQEMHEKYENTLTTADLLIIRRYFSMDDYFVYGKIPAQKELRELQEAGIITKDDDVHVCDETVRKLQEIRNA